MITALLIGAGFGAGVWALVVWTVPPRAGLDAVLSRLNAVPAPPSIAEPQESAGWAAKLGEPFVKALTDLGLPGPRLNKDLAITNRTVEAHLANKAALGITGLLLPAVASLILGAVGMWLPWQLPLLTSLTAGALGFVLPDLTVRRDAARRRADFRLALSAYLNLIRVTLAGGAGVDGALTDAATVGQGWSFTQLRRALTTAKITRTTPWASLRALGDELDVRELVELSASVSLAGTEGAKVRASLRAKAAALRTRELTDAEGQAQAASERMSLPIVVLFMGFLLFIGYPAVIRVLGAM